MKKRKIIGGTALAAGVIALGMAFNFSGGLGFLPGNSNSTTSEKSQSKSLTIRIEEDTIFIADEEVNLEDLEHTLSKYKIDTNILIESINATQSTYSEVTDVLEKLEMFNFKDK